MKKTSNVYQLRMQAASRLHPGGTTGKRSDSAPRALGLIHELASSPATAPDALVLLHELQVHQVEIDVQAEQLRNALAEQEAALARLMAIHEHMPVACLTLDRQTRIHEINAAGAKWLGKDKRALLGQTLNALLTPQSQRDLGHLLTRAGDGMEPCPLTLLTDTAPARAVLACANAASEPDRYLVACMTYHGP